MLLPDEQLVSNLLYEYGPMTKKQIASLLPNLLQQNVHRMLKNMVEHAMVYSSRETGLLYLDCNMAPDAKTHLALWVLSKFKVEPTSHYRGTAPCQIYFVRKHLSYEICVIGEGEEHLVKLLRPKPGHRFVIVVERQDQIDQMEIPDVPCLFAVTKNNSDFQEPEILFMKKETSDG